MAINLFEANEVVSRVNVNQRITGINNGISGTYLYNNSTGIRDTITLSDDYSNYDCIYVQFNDNGVNNSVYFMTEDCNQVNLFNLYRKGSDDGMWYHGALLTFTGTSAVFSRQGSLNISDTGSNVWDNTSGVYVTKIIGYKY